MIESVQEMARKVKRVPLAYYKSAPKHLLETDEVEESFVGWDLSFNE
jgi:hypothetical protein